jgi:hypothetical protein
VKKDVKKGRREDRKKRDKARRRRHREKQTEQALDPSRNLHAERGRPVTAADITPYARQKCSSCRGKGVVGRRSAGEVHGVEPCVCATKRFIKAHPEVIIDAHGVAFFPAEEPKDEAPTADGGPAQT